MKLDFEKILNLLLKGKSDERNLITLFEKVRDIPYGNINSRNPFDVFVKNKGTCSGKHELLKGLYKELGFKIRDYIIIHDFNKLPVSFPNDIQELFNNKEILDPHNYFEVLINDKWVLVDATWDKSLKKLGFPINENWDGLSGMEITVALGGKIYESENIINFKKELLKDFPEKNFSDRKLFLNKLTNWLDELREKKII